VLAYNLRPAARIASSVTFAAACERTHRIVGRGLPVSCGVAGQASATVCVWLITAWARATNTRPLPL